MNRDLELIDGDIHVRSEILSLCGVECLEAIQTMCNENNLILKYQIINASSKDFVSDCADIVSEAKMLQSFVVVSFDKVDEYDKIVELLDGYEIDWCSEYAFQLYCEITSRKLGAFTYELEKFNKVYLKYSLSCKKLIKAVENDCVLVYQRSKVGSSTICKSLDMCNIDNIHIHQLNYMRPYKFLDFRLHSSVGNVDIFNGSEEFVARIFAEIKKKSKVKIITCVRDPLARDFSEFFQALEWPAFELDRISEENMPFLEACKSYIKQTATISQEEWFDNELKHIFCVDVFEHPFDKEKGYSIIKKGNVEVLILKLEKMNLLESVISQFLGDPNFKLVNANTNDSKTSRVLYSLAKKKLSFSNDELNMYYSSKSRLLHFYTEDEFAKFKGKWNNSDC